MQRDDSSTELSGPGPEKSGLLSSQRGHMVAVLIPLALLIVLTAVFRWTEADVAICRNFYDSVGNRWPLSEQPLWKWAYDYGTLPGLLLGLGGLGFGLFSLFVRRLRPYSKYGLFLAAMLALGPGLLVNGIFKPNWRRPRPHQTIPFGGNHSFVHVWEIGTAANAKSFPCGHASMGFFLMAPAFLLYRRRRLLAAAFVGLGLISGGILGMARIAQGGHFPSDVVWSAGMVYLSGLALIYLFRRFGSFPTVTQPLDGRKIGLGSPPDGALDRRQAA